MKRFILNKKQVALWGVLICCCSLNAQIDSYTSLELYKITSLSEQSDNPAGAWVETPIKYSLLDLNMNYEKGSFHRSMEGESIRNLGFNAEGVTLINRNYLKGYFKYTNQNVKDEGYNASSIDPYRGMPYRVVDLNHSDWKNQYYDMGVRWAYPQLFDRLSVGMDVNYQAHSGAKQRDVRADVRYMKFEVRPGIYWSVNEKSQLGGFFNYYSIKEESNNSNVNSYISQEYYETNGLGNAVQGIGSGRTTNYTGDNFGGGLDYSWIDEASKWMFTSSYNVKAEKAEASFTLPREVGAVRYAIWDSRIKFYKHSNSQLSHLVQLNYVSSQIKGIEYITQRDNTETQNGWQTLYSGVRSKYKKQDVGVIYTLIAPIGNEYKWSAEWAVDYIAYDDSYMTSYSEMKSKNWLTKATFKRNIALSGLCNPHLLLTAEGVYNKSSSGKYHYTGQHSEYITVNAIQQVDNDYLRSNYWGVNLVVNYSQKVDLQTNLSWYINGAFSYVKTHDFDFNNRTKVSIAIGCVF